MQKKCSLLSLNNCIYVYDLRLLQSQKSAKIKAFIVGIVTILIFGFLFWEHFNGGVTSHHLLHQEDLPSISNWWSGLLLPILTWFLLSRMEKRFDKQSSQTEQTNNFLSKVFWFFLTGLERVREFRK